MTRRESNYLLRKRLTKPYRQVYGTMGQSGPPLGVDQLIDMVKGIEDKWRGYPPNDSGDNISQLINLIN